MEESTTIDNLQEAESTPATETEATTSETTTEQPAAGGLTGALPETTEAAS